MFFIADVCLFVYFGYLFLVPSAHLVSYHKEDDTKEKDDDGNKDNDDLIIMILMTVLN